MQLKVHTLTGPAQFSACSYVWITIQDTKDTFHQEGGGLVSRYFRWSIENEVFPVIPGASGGGSYTGAYDPQDAAKVTEWLKSQGALEVAPDALG